MARMNAKVLVPCTVGLLFFLVILSTGVDVQQVEATKEPQAEITTKVRSVS